MWIWYIKVLIFNIRTPWISQLGGPWLLVVIVLTTGVPHEASPFPAEAFLKGFLFVDGAHQPHGTSSQLTLHTPSAWRQSSSLSVASWSPQPSNPPRGPSFSPWPCWAGGPSREKRERPSFGLIVLLPGSSCPRLLAPLLCHVVGMGLAEEHGEKEHVHLM